MRVMFAELQPGFRKDNITALTAFFLQKQRQFLKL